MDDDNRREEDEARASQPEPERLEETEAGAEDLLDDDRREEDEARASQLEAERLEETEAGAEDLLDDDRREEDEARASQPEPERLEETEAGAEDLLDDDRREEDEARASQLEAERLEETEAGAEDLLDDDRREEDEARASQLEAERLEETEAGAEDLLDDDRREEDEARASQLEAERLEETEAGAEDLLEVTTNQQISSVEPSEGDQAESSIHGSHTQRTASVSDTTFLSTAEPESSRMPIPPPSSARTLAQNSMEVLTNIHGDSMSRATGQSDVDDEDEELVVLDPEHPLMKRLQSTLKSQLTKQLERLNQDLGEKLIENRMENTQCEDLGVELYSVQQELARLQLFLEGRHEATTKATVERRQAQEQLKYIKTNHHNINGQAKKQRTEVSELQSEFDNLAERLLYMKEVTSDLQYDVSAVKNATQKAKTDRRQAEQEKLQQDLYVERLTKQEDKLREQIALYKIQTLAQAEETRAARDALAEAQLEMDSLVVERKQLLQYCNSSLIGMNRRDEAYTALQKTLQAANQEVRSLDGEVEGNRRSTVQVQELNEKLTVLLNRAELNSATQSKMILQSHTQQETLRMQYSTTMRMLQEIEKSLNRVTMDFGAHKTELAALMKQVEKESSILINLEEKIVMKMQEQLMHDNTAKQSYHLSQKNVTQQRNKDSQLSKLENELATVMLEIEEVTLHCEALCRVHRKLEQEVTKKNQLLSVNEVSIAKHIIVIEHNQATISLYNKKIDQIVAKTGHKDLAPFEIKANNLSKEVDEIETEIKHQQQLWLWQQGELVKLSQEREANSSATLTLNTQLTVMQQRRLRKENEVDQETRSLAELQRHSKALMLDMQKLSALVCQNTQLRHELEQDNSLMENSFIHTLKDAERESVETQLRLEKLHEEKERLLNSLVEAERQIMLWDRKIQLARETRSVVDSDAEKGDIHKMKVEIHRMEVHYASLLKQQERLLREMEAVVTKRESITIRGEVQARSDRKHTTQMDFQHTLHSLHRAILQTHKQSEEGDKMITQLQLKQISLSDNLKEKQLQISDLLTTSTKMTTELNNLQYTRERNMTQLLALQFRVKQLQALKEGRYIAVTSDEPALQLAMQKQQERLHTVNGILQHIVQDFPEHESFLDKVQLFLSAHAHADLRATHPSSSAFH